MLIARGTPVRLGTDDSARLSFAESSKPDSAWAGRRLLLLDDQPAFEMSFWCGTCPFLFERLEGATETLSLDVMSERLSGGIDDLDDDVISTFAALLPKGEYVPLLLEVTPRLVRPSAENDYFAREQVKTWGLDAFWDLPVNPRTPYYRTFETAVGHDAHLYEFVVPMVPPSWNDTERVAAFADRLKESSRPTAIAISTLDVSVPAVAQGPDWYWHWGLTHFLLDGHHKLQAAAQQGRSLRLLTLLSLDGSLAEKGQLDRLGDLRSRPNAKRVAPTKT